MVKWTDQLLEKADIVKVISRYIPLRVQGHNHWGNCPFHHEKTPSFCVSDTKQFYHCFGCKESGNVINFVQKIESIEWREAANIIAREFGVEIPQLDNLQYDDTRYERIKKLHKILNDAAVHYYNNLTKDGGQALKYLNNRGISKELVIKFGLGVSIDGFSLIKYLKSKGHAIEDMIACGLVGVNNGQKLDNKDVKIATIDNIQDNHKLHSVDDGKGSLDWQQLDNMDVVKSDSEAIGLFTTKSVNNYDVFANRLMIPIINNMNEVIGFGGRDMSGTSKAKYRNSNQNEVFDKSKTLYGINLLKKYKQLGGDVSFVILVEGYMDAIALHKVGIENVVASMGTALTDKQARLIKNYTTNIYVSYDGDFAGQKATLRSLDILAKHDLEVKVMTIPNNLDPDEFISKNGKDAYLDLINNAEPLVKYKIMSLAKGYAIDPVTNIIQFVDTSQKIKFGEEATKVIVNLSEVAKSEYAKFIHELSGIDLETINNYANVVMQDGIVYEDKQMLEKPKKLDLSLDPYIFIFASMIDNKPWIGEHDIDIFDYVDNKYQAIYKYCVDCIQNYKKPSFNVISDIISNIDGVDNGVFLEQIFHYDYKDDKEATYCKFVKDIIIQGLIKKKDIAINTSQLVQVQEISKLIKQLEKCKDIDKLASIIDTV